MMAPGLFSICTEADWVQTAEVHVGAAILEMVRCWSRMGQPCKWTTDEIAERLHVDPRSVRKAEANLEKLGKVKRVRVTGKCRHLELANPAHLALVDSSKSSNDTNQPGPLGPSCDTESANPAHLALVDPAHLALVDPAHLALVSGPLGPGTSITVRNERIKSKEGDKDQTRAPDAEVPFDAILEAWNAMTAGQPACRSAGLMPSTAVKASLRSRYLAHPDLPAWLAAIEAVGAMPADDAKRFVGVTLAAALVIPASEGDPIGGFCKLLRAGMGIYDARGTSRDEAPRRHPTADEILGLKTWGGEA